MALDQNLKTPQSLLPADKPGERPLFAVLAILAFLATLALLSFKTSYTAAGQWGLSLKETATVQIQPGEQTQDGKLAIKTKDILLQIPQITHVDILPQSYSKELLKPWLGDVALPSDLPLPILLHLKLRKGETLDTHGVKTLLANAGVQANIDDHDHWNKDLKRSIRTIQALCAFALILICLAIFSACIFATHAGIHKQKKLMDILHQIGAEPKYTARIIGTRFALSSFRAGMIGAIGAFCLLFFMSLMFGSGPKNYLLPEFSILLKDLYLVVLVPVFMAVLSGLTTWRTVMHDLLLEIYP